MTVIPDGVGTAGAVIVTGGMATIETAAEVTGTRATIGTGIQTTETGANVKRSGML